MKTIELNEEFKKALNQAENTNDNILITGKAGTGKSTFLEYFRNNTKREVIVLAPTGVAALNVKGETIHSFFHFKPDITLQKIKKHKGKGGTIYKKIDTIIIDEVSMVRADLLDCIGKFLKLNGKSTRKPFGGTRMIFIGDLYQLPPVVTSKEKEMFKSHYKSPYFFDAEVFENLPIEFIEFEKVYRQKDENFIMLLNKVRNNSITEEELNLINDRVGAEFDSNIDSKYSIYLTTTNDMATKINEEELSKLNTKIFTHKAETEGDFNEKSFPTDYELNLKVDSQVMMLNNDSLGRWVNGTIGKIVDIVKNDNGRDEMVVVETSDGSRVDVLPHEWDLFHYNFNKEKGQLETEIKGHFTQYPMKLAWAVTIHKGQGKTFNKVIIDVGRGTFAHGQMYVALSRCTSFGGIILKKPIKKYHIWMDWRVVNFMTKYQYAISEKGIPIDKKVELINQAIKNNNCLKIIYLKTSDEKTKRIIKPIRVGECLYNERKFLGLEAYCFKRNENRVFRVDRILEIKIADNLQK
ncbi:MAG: AAA family ATPase [Candidatus Firestonebacteria bacterium]